MATTATAFVVAPPPTTSRISQTTTLLQLAKKQPNARADGVLMEKNRERIRTAGRVGTKRFVDPCKVFLGNLPFDATETDLKQFFRHYLGTTFNVKSVKIIYDWKTNKSKGYGFALFTDPMFATSAMEVLNGKPLKGRPMKLSQGKKKQDENELYIKKKKKQKAQLDAEEAAIQEGLDEAEEDDEVELDEFDDADDDLLFGDDDDEDFEYDGIFEEMYPTAQYEPLTEEELKLNREQRRDAAKRKKRRKLPHKGFEPPEV
jgi:RNA recognition motif-containing protein